MMPCLSRMDTSPSTKESVVNHPMHNSVKDGNLTV